MKCLCCLAVLLLGGHNIEMWEVKGGVDGRWEVKGCVGGRWEM